MGAIIIHDLDDAVVAVIKRRAADHGVSVEEEVRRLLSSLTDDDLRAKAWARRQAQQVRLGALREMLEKSIAQGGTMTDEQLDAALAIKRAELAKDGF